MDIGTAKPAVEQRRVAYHCLDLTDPGEPFSAALYQRHARIAIDDIAARGLVPIVCGGTGLYVRAALDVMEFPKGEQLENPARTGYERYAAESGAAALHELLRTRDPASAAVIHPNNTRRVVRALEMLDQGISYAEQKQAFSARTPFYPTSYIGVTMDRVALYHSIDLRVDDMIAHGLLGEVETLLSQGWRDALTARQAIGYKELVPVIEDGASLDDAVAAIKQATRRYAKRQLSWFRADQRIRWVDVTESSLEQAAVSALETID